MYDKTAGNTLHFYTNKMYVSDFEKQLMQQAINTIPIVLTNLALQNQIFFKQGNTKVVVELPGMSDTERAKQLLGNTATTLTFVWF